MRQPLVVVLTVLATAGTAAAQQASITTAAAVDSAFTLVRTRSVHRDGVDWPAVEAAFRERLAASPTLDDSLAAFTGVFEALGDVHSGLHHGGRQYAWWRGASADEAARVAPLVERANAQRGRADGRLLAEAIGYVVVPTIYASPEELAGYADAIRGRLCELAAAGATRWIVDLRLNMGGTMHPMLTGLGPLLGDGKIGSFTDAAGRTTAGWSIRDGISYVGEQSVVVPTIEACAIAPEAPVAVLLGPVTMSSGQIVAVAFSGRPATRSFGEATADGYTTANEWMQLTPELALNLSVGYIADRIGRVYPRVVEPDVRVPAAADFDDPGSDPVVQAAIAWLDEAVASSAIRQASGTEEVRPYRLAALNIPGPGKSTLLPPARRE